MTLVRRGWPSFGESPSAGHTHGVGLATSLAQLDGVTVELPGADGHPLRVLQDVDLTIEAGEFVAVVGPSGAGKTTLLRLLAGLVPVTRGRVLVRGQPVAGAVPGVGCVFQRPPLLPWRTVIDNVLLPAELVDGARRSEWRETADRLIGRLGLRGFEQARPHQLSGGMRQRVALAQALLLKPSLLLLDEPLGALDAITREDLQLLLLSAWAGSSATAVLVTHDLTEAAFLADRVVLLSPGPGQVVFELAIPLARPRLSSHREDAAYVAACAELRVQLKLTRGVRTCH